MIYQHIADFLWDIRLYSRMQKIGRELGEILAIFF